MYKSVCRFLCARPFAGFRRWCGNNGTVSKALADIAGARINSHICEIIVALDRESGLQVMFDVLYATVVDVG